MDGLLDFVEAVSARCTAVLREPVTDLPDLGEALEQLLVPAAILLGGGKRIRAQLCAVGWKAAGGEVSDTAVVRAGSALELFQAAALVHDDVIDDADTRRGQPAIHILFAGLHPGAAGVGDAATFGMHAAILLGDLILVLAHREMRRAGEIAPGGRAAARIWDLMTAEVAVGQYLDVRASVQPLVRERLESALAGALLVVRHKSARYSVQHPLVLGAALAGGDPTLLSALGRIGLPLGEAFQLRDDELGVFGDPRRTGKPAGDDILEGKRTPLVLLGLEMCPPDDSAFLRASLGNRSLGVDAIARIRTVLRTSGAVERHEALIAERYDEAMAALEGAPLTAGIREHLRAMAVALTRRVS